MRQQSQHCPAWRPSWHSRQPDGTEAWSPAEALHGSGTWQSEAAEQINGTLTSTLVNLDGAVDLADEPVGGKETDGAGEDPESEDNDEGVPKVQ